MWLERGKEYRLEPGRSPGRNRVSIAGSANRHCPLVLESDILSLSPSLVVLESMLYDQTVQIAHKLHGAGLPVVVILQRPTTYPELLQVAQEHCATASELHGLLGFLNKIGGLHRKRTREQQWLAWRITVQHLLLGVRYTPFCIRSSASSRSLMRSTLHATTPVLLAIGVVAALNWGAGFIPGRTALILALFGQIVLLLSVLLHEYIHMIVLRRAGLAVDILQLGMHVGLIHTKAEPSVEVASALAGPLVAGGASILAAVALWMAMPTLAYIAVVVGVLHIASLVPLYGDGASLVTAIQERNIS